MSCNSGTCQSSCYKDEYSVTDQPPATANYERSNDASLRGGDSNGQNLCIKCKVNETMAATHSAAAAAGGDIGRFCADCFRNNLFGKFRFAVTSNAMITPSDKVLVAFSGGSSSRVALQFVHEMQQKAQKNFDASRDRSLPVFGVGVAYINESIIFPAASNDLNQAVNDMELIVSSLAPPEKQFFVVPTQNIYSPDCAVGKNQLTELVAAVSDATGKEDLLEHLRMLSLQKIASENGYTKIVLGTCTSRIASHVLEATVKGQGFSLAADIQYVDARWETPVVLPLRDCLSEELNTLCSLDSLKTIEVLQQPRSGINGLISSFVQLLQKDNPSRESTILRTAGKLTPFHFNRIPEDGHDNGHSASQRRQRKYNLKPNESLPPKSFCFICNSPLKKSSNTSLDGFENGGTSAGLYTAACSSCQYQILPKDPSSLEYFYSLLPKSMADLENDSRNNHNISVLLDLAQKMQWPAAGSRIKGD
ncbi:hypothetical protein BUALT_Bualt16G0119500 [Buddleja alternifolia]|uniref:Cytoplasmic tRNA 2-thiolation protein 2 n=1 Tax=Buddleja alternifolia TaxID=168488 RepID=A0AAV6WB33_9LAMI|nr:hypothetical protein BUALT_Bualt16G0119500 [Buddleja alternifolia]